MTFTRAAVTAVGGVLVLPASAAAYGRVVTSAGQPFRWAESCIFLTPSPAPSPDLSPADIAAVTSQAMARWSRAAQACTYLDLRLEEPTEGAGRVRADGVNSIVFRQDRWCRETDEPGPAARCYDRQALALTSFFGRDADGRIFDADIEMNGVDFRWGHLDEGAPRSHDVQDLANALTHELGHVIGLDHNCHPDGAERRGLDGAGQPLPSCTKPTPEIEEATMFVSATPGDISKRTLADDDIRALCESYPVAADPGRCEPAALPPRGCAFATGSTGWLASLPTVTAAAWSILRTRRTR